MEIKGLLELSGAEFVEAAYEEILRREPDADGMEVNLLNLLLGFEKKEILMALCLSKEGRTQSGYSAERLISELTGAGVDCRDLLEKRSVSVRIRRGLKRRILRGLFKELTDTMVRQQISLFELRKSNLTGYASGSVFPGTAGKTPGADLPEEIYQIYRGLREGADR